MIKPIKIELAEIKEIGDELQKVIDKHPGLHVMITISAEDKNQFYIYCNSCAACMLDIIHEFEREIQPKHDSIHHDEDEVIH